MRYVVVGTSGSGKTVLARELALAVRAPYVELDEIHWLENWTPKPASEFIECVVSATEGEKWVVDGNYSATRDALWPRATHIVWLNFSRTVVFPRVLWRTVKRAILRQELWNGNRESTRKAFFSKSSILLWSFSTYENNRRKYAALKSSAAYSHLSWVELRNPSEAKKFLASIAPLTDA